MQNRKNKKQQYITKRNGGIYQKIQLKGLKVSLGEEAIGVGIKVCGVTGFLTSFVELLDFLNNVYVEF